MARTFRSLADLGRSGFCRGAADPAGLEGRLRGLLGSGTTRPEWCWLAMNEGGRAVARQVWWAVPGAAAAAGVDLLDTADLGAAGELLTSVRDRLDVEEAICELHAPIGGARAASGSQPELVSVLESAGYPFSVARVSVERVPDGGAGVLTGAGVLPATASTAGVTTTTGGPRRSRSSRWTVSSSSRARVVGTGVDPVTSRLSPNAPSPRELFDAPAEAGRD